MSAPTQMLLFLTGGAPCQLTQAGVYNGRKMVVVVVVIIYFQMTTTSFLHAGEVIQN